MVKLFTDEEMDESCKDYRAIPLALRDDIFTINNQDTELKIGYVTPVNINQYSISLSKFYGIDKGEYVKEYNKIYDKKIAETTIDEDIIEEIKPKRKRLRRTKTQMKNAKGMAEEDINIIEEERLIPDDERNESNEFEYEK